MKGSKEIELSRSVGSGVNKVRRIRTKAVASAAEVYSFERVGAVASARVKEIEKTDFVKEVRKD